MIDSQSHHRAIHRVRAITAVIALIAIVGLGVLAVPTGASAVATYSISGHVDLNPGTPVAAGSGAVTAIATTSPNLPVQAAGSADTDAAGDFAITGLVPGVYYVYLQYNGPDGYQSSWTGEAPYATTGVRKVTITSTDVTGASWDLYLSTTISGQVTLGSAGTPAAAGEVLVSYQTEDVLNGPFSAESAAIPTDAQGNYAFPNVKAGFYRLHFVYAGSGAYESEYLGLTRSGPLQTSIPGFRMLVNGPFVENIDLPSLVSVSGHVSIGTAAVSATSGEVTATLQYYYQYGGGWVDYPAESADTDASGNYSFTGLNVFEQYRVILTYHGTGNYLGTTTKTIYPVTSSSITQDALIPFVHSISGHVYVGSTTRSATAGEVQIGLYNNTYDYSASVLTDASGNYSATGLPDGTYFATLHYVGTGNYVDTLIYTTDACVSSCSFDLSADRTGINGTIRTANDVSGAVMSWDTNAPLAGIKIAAKEYDSNTGAYVGEFDATSSTDGTYSFVSLPEGKYEFDVTDPTSTYASTVIDAAPNRLWLNSSQPQILPTTNLQGGRTISGSVVIVGGSASDVAGGAATVQLMSERVSDGVWADSGQPFPIALSNGTDKFAITGVPNGAYKLRYDYHGAAGDAVAFSPIVFVDPNNLLIVPVVSLYPEHPASTVADFSITGDVGAIGVRGWAAWPSSLSSSVSLAVNVGPSWYPVTANLSNTFMNDADTLGTNHGFSWSLPAPLAAFNACLWTTEPTGPAENLGCTTVYPQPPSSTTYGLDSMTGLASGVSVAGWAQYPDFPSSSVGVALNIGSSWYGFTANQANSDVGAGSNHGYSGIVPLAPGTYNVCVWVTEPAGGAANTGCHQVVVPAPARAIVHSDAVAGGIGSVSVAGWDVFPESLSSHVGMAVNVGSSWYGMTADSANSEVLVAYPAAGSDHGYSGRIPLPPGTYNVCIWTTEPSGPAVNAGCQVAVVTPPSPAVVHSDSVAGEVGSVSVSGWDVFPDSLSTHVGMAVNIGSNWYGMTANVANSETLVPYPSASADHGYATTIGLPPGAYSVCIWTVEPNGPAVNAGCHAATVTAAPPAVTSFDAVAAVAGGIQVTGYSQYPGTPSAIVGVAAQIGSNWFGFTANGVASNPTHNGHGFTGFIPASHGTYNVCMWTTEPGGGAAVNFGCKSVTVP